MKFKNLILLLIVGASFSCAKDDDKEKSVPVPSVPKEILGNWSYSSHFLRPLLGVDGMGASDSLYQVKVASTIGEISIKQVIEFDSVADSEGDETSPTLVSKHFERRGFLQVKSLADDNTEMNVKWVYYFCMDKLGAIVRVNASDLDQALQENKLSLQVKEDSLLVKTDDLRESTWKKTEPRSAAPRDFKLVDCSELPNYKAEFDRAFAP